MNMRKIVEDTEDGLTSMLGERVQVWSLNYIYVGKLVGVNDSCLRLDDAAVVYETGPLNEAGYSDAQPVPHPVYVMLRCVESVTREV